MYQKLICENCNELIRLSFSALPTPSNVPLARAVPTSATFFFGHHSRARTVKSTFASWQTGNSACLISMPSPAKQRNGMQNCCSLWHDSSGVKP